MSPENKICLQQDLAERLEETRVVRSWGVQSVAIAFVDGFSTTALVQRIRHPASPTLRKAAFLDRDGVINQDKAYVQRYMAWLAKNSE